jgi:hypothetical protein
MASPPLTVEMFFDHVRHTNPFLVNRVAQPSGTDVDAGHIHEEPFQRLVEHARQALQQQVGIGAALWGEAGIGKSHLLSRLARWASQNHAKQACFVYLYNLQASPEHLPRSLLRGVISTLTRGRTSQFHDTPLFRLVNASVREAVKHAPTARASWAALREAYDALVNQLGEQEAARAALVDHTVYRVLFRFFQGAYLANGSQDDALAELAVRWLAGDYLDTKEAKQLGLPSSRGHDEVVAIADDEQVKRVLVALTQLARWRQQPFVLCFDQVDNLEPEQFGTFARFLHAFLDSANNLLIVTSGIQPTLLDWLSRKIIQESTWQRLMQFEIDLQRIDPQQARQIVEVRLMQFIDPFLVLNEVKRQVEQDSLFPLGQSWFRDVLQERIAVRPREVINWARDGWRREVAILEKQGGCPWLAGWLARQTPYREPQTDISPQPITVPERSAAPAEGVIDQVLEQKLHEQKMRRVLEPHQLPPNADNLSGLVSALLRQCLQPDQGYHLIAVQQLQRPKAGAQPAYDFLIRQHATPSNAEVRTGVLCLATRSRTSMAGFLRRLANDRDPPDRVVLVTDERLPFDPGVAGQRYLEQLRQRDASSFHHLTLTFAEYAELDALQAVVGLARSGDLEIEPASGQTRRVTEAEVIASHHRRQRYLAHPLLRLVLTGSEPPEVKESSQQPPPDERPKRALSDARELREFIMAQLALTMGMSSHELAARYAGLRQRESEVQACRSCLEEVAKELHQEGRINASPHEDGLYLLPR